MESYQVPPPESALSGLKYPILFGAVIALLGANLWQFFQIRQLTADVSTLRQSVNTEIAKVKESTTHVAQSSSRTIAGLNDQLETYRRQASIATGQAKIEATRHAEELAARLEKEQQKMAQQTQKLGGELTEVKTAASSTAAKLEGVNTEVGNVKTEVASTKAELDKTISQLKSVQGDMGVQSGLIATNGKELNALKALGERNYFEFNLGKTKQPQRVGDISVQLKKTDMKRNKYTVEIIADDKRVEKKDKNANEPVQFYTSKARQPYEFVVNEVGKDKIVGYLATPKVQTSRN
jgi:chromosome segregation ATPase